jgi:hypothetical protein
MAEFFWRAKPFHGSSNIRTLAPNERAISSVRSQEPLSTRLTSSARSITLANVRAMFASSLQATMATESELRLALELCSGMASS